MKPPSESGKVVRYQDEYWLWFRDRNAGYTLFLGVDIREFCNGVDDFDEFNFRDIFVPNTDPGVVDRIVSMARGDDIRAYVWSWSDPSTQGCAYYTSIDPIANGTARVIGVDNDLVMWGDPDRNNANSYGWSVHGTLEDPEGQVYNLSAHFRYVWKWAWPADGSKDKISVKINLH
jgi:hypothetical protein